MSLMIFITPQNDHPKDGTIFVAAVAELQGLAEKPVKEYMPEQWDREKMKVHLVSTAGIIEVEAGGSPLTHIALIESDCGKNDPFMFGGWPVTHNSAILFYNENTAEFHFISDRDTAWSVINWLAKVQEAWQFPSKSVH